MTASGPALTFRNAPLEEAAAIMREAAQWLEQRGEMLWPQSDLTSAALAQRCQPHEVFVGDLAGVAVTCALIQTEDFLWPNDGAALIVHKLAVRREHAGRGFAMQMLEFAAQRAREAGRIRLRLDCANRPRLRAFYESAGFTFVKLGNIGPLGVALYERAL